MLLALGYGIVIAFMVLAMIGGALLFGVIPFVSTV